MSQDRKGEMTITDEQIVTFARRFAICWSGASDETKREAERDICDVLRPFLGASQPAFNPYALTDAEKYPSLDREEIGQVTARVFSDRYQHDRANAGKEPVRDQVACSLVNGRGNKCTCDAAD
jgi:hypothetical protein